jgi:hypothetical protein
VDVAAWAEAYRRAWEERDAAAAVAALFTEDAESRSGRFREPDRGRGGVSAYWERAIASQREVSVRMGTPWQVEDGRHPPHPGWSA